MADAVRKYFCPRLLDYIVVSGVRQPNRNLPVQPPELLRRYPTEDHADFPLPTDVVFFCQPEGCLLVGPRRTSLRESTPFVFALTEKDTSRVRYGICVNFFRPFDRAALHTQRSSSVESGDGGSVPEYQGGRPIPAPRARRRKRLSSHSLVSLCIISHHPFFSTFRECLFALRKLVDSSHERLLLGSRMANRIPSRDSVWNVFLGRVSEGYSSAVLHEVREIETWMLKLLSAPVPVPGKTRVEVAILPRRVEQPLIFALPDHTRFSLVDFPLHLPLELLGVDTCIKVLTCIVLEHKLVLQSRDYNALSMSVMAFVTMIYPLEYMFPVIPLLPTCMASAEQLLLAPTPFIIGVPATFFKLKRSFCLPDDVWLVDLDSNSVLKPPGVEDLPPLPDPEGSHLSYHLKQALASMSINPQPIKNLDRVPPPRPSIGGAPADKPDAPAPLSGFNPFIYGNDVDSVDVATRIAMVRFFNSVGVLAHFMEHTRTLRLYPRPVVAFQVNTFLHSRTKQSHFLRKFVRTQAVEFYAEWSLCPTNVAFLRVHTGVFDPAVIGDKAKWYSHQLEPIQFEVWSENCTLNIDMASIGQADETSTGESGSESDDASSTSSSYSSLSDFVCDMVEFNGDHFGGAHMEEVSAAILNRADYMAAFNPPKTLQLPGTNQQNLRRTDSENSVHGSVSSSSPSSSLSSPTGQPQGDPGDAFEAPKADAKQEVRPETSGIGGSTAGLGGGDASAEGEPPTPSTVRSGRSPGGSLSSGLSTPPDTTSGGSGTPRSAPPLGGLGGVLNRAGLSSQGSQSSLFETVAREAKEVAREATKAAAEVSRTALEATKPAREAGRKTLMKALSDRDKEKQESGSLQATGEGQHQQHQHQQQQQQQQQQPAMFQRRDSGSLMSTVSSELNGFAAHTSNVIQGISGLFGNRVSAAVKGRERAPPFGPFPKANMGRRGPVERTPLIKHVTPQQGRRVQPQEQPRSVQTFEEQSSTQSDNQQFLKDVLNSVANGEGIKWFKKNRIARLMEDESYRNVVVLRLNRTLERRVGPDGHIKDVMISKAVYKGTLRMLQLVIGGLEHSFHNCGIGGMASALQVLEIAHTHFWAKDLSAEAGMQESVSSSARGSISAAFRPQSTEPSSFLDHSAASSRKNSLCAQDGRCNNRSSDNTPFGSGEHLNRHPGDSLRADDITTSSSDIYGNNSPVDASPQRDDRGSFDRSSLVDHRFSLTDMSQHAPPLPYQQQPPPQMNVIPSSGSIDHSNESSDMFRGLLNAKKLVLSKLTSIDSEVSDAGTSQGSDLTVPSGNVSDTGSVTMNPAFFRQSRGGSNASFRSTVSDSEVEAGGFMMSRQMRASSIWSTKSSLSGGFGFTSGSRNPSGSQAGQGASPSTPTRSSPPPQCRTYIYQGLIGKERASIWSEPQFWEDAFFDAVAQERDLIGMDQQPGVLMERYRSLSSPEKKRLEHDEDRLLSTLLSNLIAFMLMMEVPVDEIRRRARRLLGKCHISLVYSAELNTILDALDCVDQNGTRIRKYGNEIDLKPLGSRQMQSQCFTVHTTTNTDDEEVRFLEVRDDGLVLRGANGVVIERWWYERLVNMSYCPKNKVLCLWRRSSGQTQLHKYYTKKCKDMYYCIKEAMERAAAQGNVLKSGTELGGEFPVLDLTTREGGILQVCMEGVGLLFANSKFFVRIENIKRCYTQKDIIFVLEEYNPKTHRIIERKYESKMANDICYAVLCVFSYVVSGDPRPSHP
ncbi:rab3 GDP-GTP exchange factor isoform X1 [Dermacentor variabilis]|uniref:rab3 GDP-GTP exchange factor isoform X1 n=1 Tax=Dermacentor variabilis TaxID=34621 RepID=UPI003F5BA4BA